MPVDHSLEAIAADTTALPHRFGPVRGDVPLVRRQLLLRELTEASLLRPLTIVRGPAGSGKTVLLTQWADLLRQMERPAAWLTLDASDRAPALLIAGIAEALAHAGYDDLAEAFAAIAPSFSPEAPETAARRLAAAVNRTPRKPILILDGCEAIDAPEAFAFLSSLLLHSPALRLVLSSRRRPQLPLGALRARNQLLEIGPGDLAFTPAEIHALLSNQVPELYTRRLHASTSGSAVAVAFARRSLDHTPRPGHDCGTWQDWLGDYFRDEVLSTLDPDLRTAMSRLVVVERFDLSLAEALVGNVALSLVEKLYHDEGLLLRDLYTQEFHFPEMLRRFLDDRLALMDAKERAALHARAAEWFADRGLFQEALRHAIEAGERERALALIEQVGATTVVTRQGIAAARLMLDSIGIAADPRCPSAQLSLAVVSAHEGRIVDAVERLQSVRLQLESAEAGTDTLLIDRQFLIAEGFVNGFLDQRASAEDEAALERYIVEAAASDHHGRAQVHILRSWNSYCSGDLVKAERAAVEAAIDYAGTESVFGALFMHVHRMLAQFWRNDLEGALAESALGEKMVRLFFPEDQRLRVLTEMLRTSIQFELGKPDLHANPLDLAAMVGAVEAWVEVQLWAHRYAARAAAAANRLDEARAILANGVEVSERLQTPRLAWNMGLTGALIEARSGAVDKAWRDVEALGLPGGAFLSGTGVPLTWQERIGGLLALAELQTSARRLDEAAHWLHLAEEEVGRTSALRFATAIDIAWARIHHAEAKPVLVRAKLQAACGHCQGLLPARLFVEAGADLQPYLAELPGWSTPDPQRGDIPVAGADPVGASSDPLTARERQILHFMGEGHPNKVTAHRLGLSEATIKFHLRNIYRKLSAQNRTQALARYRALVGAAPVG
ncbi:LuxR C-terminal-related transcriptional regulator [Sphingosinicella xenopeptidilytica]|uniref:LuxR C-terminal-related transcriptional regulator n=1 Tax=Sphingosinicella xenopeptidilytica TaxID=364098 RepID=A0ABW3C0L3_SPHXN